MKLMGRDITGDKLLEEIMSRLEQRGLQAPGGGPIRFDGLEPRLDPVAFNVEALSEHADPTRPLPLETHRAGLGRAVLLAKWLFRKGGQLFINEAFSRQKRFNAHVRDSYAQLAAEMKTLRERLDALEKPAKPEKPEKPTVKRKSK
jgi:hypothetical protein